ncbi:uncharacterized protein LOC6555594 [Drosophila erecta]|uniref:Uncharacterized protein n=1 Tax=Drosophila erecta TaxID=7220 RepID=B3P9A5_DROER|nr:uncharacterized protein LOC6555594 [Drosophila erecta]EDV45401.1 uncharacterized protein Dere_GG12741 [Drosophila erecta]
MFGSASFNALCGVGVPRPNFQRLIEYVDPEPEDMDEENAMIPVWRRQELSSASSLSEMRIRCPEAFVRATVVGVNPETGQPVVQSITYHRTLGAGLLAPHPSVRRRPKLTDIPQERLSWDYQAPDEKPIPAKLEVIWQSPSLTGCRDPRRVRGQMDFAKQKAKEGKLLDSVPVRKKAKKVRSKKETRKLTHDKATSMAGFSSPKTASRSVRAGTRSPKRKSIGNIDTACVLDLELRRVLAKYRVSASQLSKRLHRLVLEELPETQVEGGRTKIPNSKKAREHKCVRGATITWSTVRTSQPKALDGRVAKNTEAVHSCDSSETYHSSSLATDSQENNELATAAGLTAAFVRRHKLFQLLASKR